MSIFISNSGPLNRRNEAVKALMDLIPCHSFGHFSHNQVSWEGCVRVEKRGRRTREREGGRAGHSLMNIIGPRNPG